MASDTRSDDATDDPIGYFLEDQRYHGRSDRTVEAYERVLRSFETFLHERGGGTVVPADVGRRDCMAWVHSLRGDHAESTVATYASYVHRFYDYMVQIGVFESNPMALVVEEMDESIDTDPTRRELSVAEMRTFVATIGHPLERAVVVTLLKTGMRVGELCNLDRRDLNVSFEGLTFESDPRAELEGRPQSLYVGDEPARGTTINGERRTASNKRKRSTVIPVDDELRRTLCEWLAVRPDPVSPAEPLFLDTGESWGTRLQPSEVRYVVRRHASRHGWYRTGGGATENVTPHYFRHFFTTHLRDRTGERGIVKYLRGDVASDVIDTYTHNWGDRVRTVYERHVYSLLRE
ncbi:tyrosine-type recombinase/integrase [Natrialbaceae archaeon AArc-T1-2]|uniref:tyrosine-type recombinase/integrase n=1 Tax=Natrialbaceae archaeon AArc-T1-2 TaxID=3053904 RepID=UPI00255B3B1B|nr:tyrosine-type recombinase/integrase [Natrialbaceae archaeon AArc-T1-2]WIV67266.1 tyrosine-type recombinase/integrase [Natrialbaceae archaeon AArc-T1-2]